MRLTWIAMAAIGLLGEAVSGCGCTSRPAAPPKIAPSAGPSAQADTQLTYKDADSEIIVCVESDRRHVAAIDSNGKILWHRNLIVETDEKPSVYSLNKLSEQDVAYMKRLGKSGSFVGVSFNIKERGLIDVRTGEYFKLPRD